MSELLAVDLIPSSLTEQELTSLFSLCPGVLRCQRLVNAQGQSIGSAVIEVSNSRDAQRIIQTMDGFEIAGKAIRVSRLEPPQFFAAAPHEADRKSHRSPLLNPCAHRRLVDEQRDAQGHPTGNLICLECSAVLPDPLRKN